MMRLRRIDVVSPDRRRFGPSRKLTPAAGALVCLAASYAAGEAKLERSLANPPATGLLIVQTLRDSPAEKLGLKEGDILLKYAGVALTSVERLKSLIAQNARARDVELILHRDGKTLNRKVRPGALGVRTAHVEKGKKKWSPSTTPYNPDLSGLAGDYWMTFEMRGRRVGFVRWVGQATGNQYASDTRVAFAGDGLDERIRVRILSGKNGPFGFRSVRYENGRAKIVVEAKRDGRRIAGSRAGKRESIHAPARTIPSYAIADLATTLPLKEGARIQFNVFEEENFRIQTGHELVCLRRERVSDTGQDIGAWLFEDRQYGERGNRYWVDGKRRLAKATWGESAQSVAAARDDALKRLPAKITAFAR